VMNLWEKKRQDPEVNVESEITDVHTCLRALEIGTKRWEIASIFTRLLRAGLPDSEQKKPTDSSVPPARPSPPRPQQEQAHDRAMQPPRLTDGWHWFSKVDIASQYQPASHLPSTPQSAVDIRPYTRFSEIPRPQPTVHANPTVPFQPIPSYRIHAAPPQPQSHKPAAQTNAPLVTTVTGELPWWAEAAVDGRPAYGAISEVTASLTPDQGAFFHSAR